MEHIKYLFIFILSFATQMGWTAMNAQSFVHEVSPTYVAPTDPAVKENLEKWQDLKFGILLHWGLYSVMGRCESWELTSEDWITPDPELTYEEFKQYYWGQIRNFNPTEFNPAQWAQVAKDAGMKYVVCTSKHHDGFCLFDSKQTDFTVMNSPFGTNPRADVLKYIFQAFRNEGMKIGCYFSKPDWHSQDYWWSHRATPNRMHNYSIEKYPERWRRYQSFVYNQIEELTTGYGNLDILWLDGGWCTPPREDIRLDSIVDMARTHQPGIIVVDRACPGKHENYQTPEQQIPEHQILNPWETCLTLTNDWGWTPRPVFKSAAKVIASLSEVVAKGGSLLLGVGPTPTGLIEEQAVSILKEVGVWTKANAEAIYSTVPTPVYTNETQNVWFTANKDGSTIYAVIPRKDDQSLPATVSWKGNIPKKGTRISILSTGKAVPYTVSDESVKVTLPSRVHGTLANGIVLKIKVKVGSK